MEDIRKALRIVAAIKEAETKGSGVIALDGRMLIADCRKGPMDPRIGAGFRDSTGGGRV